MGAIALDANKVQTQVLPKLEKSRNVLQEAYSDIAILKSTLPSSYPHKGTLNEITTNMYTVKKEIKDVDSIITKKVEKAKQIENKSQSKTNDIASMFGSIFGTIKGAAIGATAGPVGAVVGGIIGNKVGSVAGNAMANTGAKVVEGAKNFFSGIFDFGKKVVTKVKDTVVSVGAKVVSGVKTVFTKAVDFGKKVGAKVVSGVKTVFTKAVDFGKKVVTKVKDTVVSVGAKVVSGVKTVFNKVVDFGKKVGATVVAGVKGFASGVVNFGKSIIDGAKWVGSKVASFFTDKVLPVIKNIGSAIWTGVKWVGTQIVRMAATVVNAVVSLVEGVVSFVEAIVDAVVLIAGGLVGSICGMVVDLVQGLTGNGWDWSATGAVWKKGLLPFIGTDWTSKAFSWQGKWIINDWAYKPFKRDETGAKIVKGVGYVVGIIIATIVTAGGAGAGAAVGSTVSSGTQVASAVIAGTAKLGQTAQESYNTVIDKSVEEQYVKEIMTANPNLEKEDAEKIVQENIKNGIYSNYDKVKQNAMDNISGKQVRGIVGSSIISGVVEGGTWYLTYGNGMKTLTKSSNKVVSSVGKVLVKGGKWTKAGLQATKSYINSGAESMVTGEFDWSEANKAAAIDAGVSLIYDSTVGKNIGDNHKSAMKSTKDSWNEALDKLSPEARSAAWNSYFQKHYDGAEHVLKMADDAMPASSITDEFSDTVTDEMSEHVLANFKAEFSDNVKIALGSAGGKKIVGKAVKGLMKEEIKGKLKSEG